MRNKKIVFFTGAGVSAESGISTFRDKDGLWEEYDIKDICTTGCLNTNRNETIEFYNKRRVDLKDKRPNIAHHTIAKLQKQYPDNINIITQNVDDLFEKAECQDVLHLHGFLTEVVCEEEECLYKRDIGYENQKVACPLCGEYIRPNIVFFGEKAPKYWDMYELLSEVDMIIIIGTSGNVINVHHLIEDAKYSILNNLEHSYAIKDDMFDKVIYERATVAIDEIKEIIIKYIKGSENEN
ncbi:MAG: NAD-dependent deacetylase [Arcobacteraceae bacterium]|nr:NAD-dependent deacetylase [Arcobacteraceae bacterium]